MNLLRASSTTARARPSNARPSNARPSNARPSNAWPSNARPEPARTGAALLGVGLLGALALVLVPGCAAGPPPPALVAETGDLPHTTLVPARGAPLEPGRNQLWCAPVALAWAELGSALGGQVLLARPNAAATRLDAEPFPPEALDPESFSAFAELGGADAAARVGRAQRRAGLAVDTELVDGVERASGPVAYAQLAKALSFPVRFEDLPLAPVDFRATPGSPPVPVDAFGVGRFDVTLRPHQRLREQLAIHETDDRASTSVVIDTDQGDRVVLALVEPGPTLEATWRSARALIETREAEPLSSGDEFRVPELDFDLRHAFTELEGAVLASPGFEGRRLERVRQDLRVKLDERGLVVRSRARMGATSAAALGPRRLHFDRPFLLAAIEEGASTPYLVAWIGHPELLLAAR